MAFFYSYLGRRIFLALGLSILVGVLDGFGIAMFLPMLHMVSEEGMTDPESLGFMAFIVDAYQYLGLSMTLVVVLLTMVLFFALKGLALYVKSAYDTRLLELFSRQLRIKTLTGLNGINFKAFVTSDLGRIQNGMTGEVDRLNRAQISYFGALQQSVMVAVYAGFAFLTDYRFALLVLGGGLATNLFYQAVYRQTKKLSREVSYHFDVYEGKIIQHVQNFKYLKATGLLSFFGLRLKETILEIQHSRTKIGMLSALLVAAREPILVAVVALVIYLMTTFLGGSLGAILMSLLFFYRALSALTVLQGNWNQFLSVSGSMESMQEFLEMLREEEETDGQQSFNRLREGIELRRVSFQYGDTPVLHDIDLTIAPRTSLALVGESGSGKTTLVNILAALLPVDLGSMYVDGMDVRRLQRESLQQRIGYITQEPVVFNDTIFNNVTLWAEDNPANRRRFEWALRQASLRDYVDELPRGSHTLLGHSGISLSGGQRQRLSIARELYKDIDILIMDEATSALDSETERTIQENIDALQGKYTLIIIAHRLSTVRNVDTVLYMDRGHIVDSGSFDSLVERVPRFRRMVELQELA